MKEPFSDALLKRVTNETIEDALAFSLKQYQKDIERDFALSNLKASIQRINNCWNLILKQNPTLVYPKDFFKGVAKEFHLGNPDIMNILNNYPDYIKYFKSL